MKLSFSRSIKYVDKLYEAKWLFLWRLLCSYAKWCFYQVNSDLKYIVCTLDGKKKFPQIRNPVETCLNPQSGFSRIKLKFPQSFVVSADIKLAETSKIRKRLFQQIGTPVKTYLKPLRRDSGGFRTDETTFRFHSGFCQLKLEFPY